MLAAFEIVRSDEGKRASPAADEQHPLPARRDGAGRLEPLGDPSAIVPVRVGAEGLARIASRNLAEFGAIANLVEYPAVPQGGARFRVQVMADHKHQEIDVLVAAMLQAMRTADLEFRSHRETEREDAQSSLIAGNPAAKAA